MTCDAFHDGHDCTLPGACTTALAALLVRCEDRRRTEHDEQLAELERRKVRTA